MQENLHKFIPKNQHRQQISGLKTSITIMSSDISAEDQVDIQIEPPKQQQQKLKATIEWKLQLDEQIRRINFYLQFNVNYLKNLMKKQQPPSVPQNVKSYISPNCILYTQFCTEKNVKGNLQLHFQYYKGLSILIYFKAEDIGYDYGWAKLNYKAMSEWKVKGWRVQKKNLESREHGANKFQFLIIASQLTDFLKQNFLFDIQISKLRQNNEQKYRGIQNMGNTCYLNSFLQILYFIKPIRKIILECKNPKYLTQKLQQLFCQMSNQKKNASVSAQGVLKCFSHFNNYLMQQQDIHQFLITFFDVIQEQLPQVKQFWEGKGTYITQSHNKKYKSVQEDIFNELDLHMDDHNTNRFFTIEQALKYLLIQQKVDQAIDTDQFGKLSVTKKRYFQQLPNLMFFNLKRYHYDPTRKTLTKILSIMKYPQRINLSFMLETPNDSECLDYSLYAVTVHKGRSPQSGHYYSFVNTSNKLNQPQWYKFNDSQVSQTDLKYVLENFQGKKQKQIVLNKQYGRWVEKQCQSDETAYLLVYLRNQIFEEYQNVNYKLPQWYIQKQKQKILQQQQIKTMNLQLYVLEPQKSFNFNPFDDDFQYLEFPLQKNLQLMKQLKQLQANYIGSTVGTVWKVNRQKKTIKYCGKKYGPHSILTVDRICGFKKSHTAPDYLLVIPLQLSTKNIQNLDNINQLVLLQINSKQGKQFEIVPRNNLQIFIERIQNIKGKKIEKSDEKMLFKYKWNDYCVLNVVYE